MNLSLGFGKIEIMILEQLRTEYHKGIFEQLLSVDASGVPNNADKHSQISVDLAKGIVETIALDTAVIKTSGQTSGKSFEKLTATFIEKSFRELRHLRAGSSNFSSASLLKPSNNMDTLPYLPTR